MKNRFSFVFALIVSALLAPLAHAQWDYGQNSIDNIIESRIDKRKTLDRIRKQRGAGSKRKGTSRTRGTKARSKSHSSRRQATVPRKQLVALSSPPTPSVVEFHRDTFQTFHIYEDGYDVNFTFTSTTGKVLRRSYKYSFANCNTEFGDIPAGNYRVTAQCVYKGRSYPVLVGSEEGSTTDPKAGNFAPSMMMKVAPQKDSNGTLRLLTVPDSLYVRVVE